jgi:hypothetical protein
VNDAKYIGLDLHQATICAAVLDGTGKLVLECTLETKTATVLFLKRLHGSLKGERGSGVPLFLSLALEKIPDPSLRLTPLSDDPLSEAV